MEKWVVILGIWAMCATCAVLFIRGATGGPDKLASEEERTRRQALRASAGDTRAAVRD